MEDIFYYNCFLLIIFNNINSVNLGTMKNTIKTIPKKLKTTKN